jgi:hypothetical protein
LGSPTAIPRLSAGDDHAIPPLSVEPAYSQIARAFSPLAEGTFPTSQKGRADLATPHPPSRSRLRDGSIDAPQSDARTTHGPLKTLIGGDRCVTTPENCLLSGSGIAPGVTVNPTPQAV